MQKRRSVSFVIGCTLALSSWTTSSLITSCGWSRMATAHAAEFLVSDRGSNRILRYNADDGSYLGPLVDNQPENNGGLFMPSAMVYGFDGDLFVTSIDIDTGEGQVLRYVPATGEFLGIFATGLIGPAGLHYHEASDTLLVGSLGTGLGDTNQIARFDSDGTRQDDIAEGPVTGRTGMVSAADGTLYVSGFAEGNFFSGSVLKYDYDSSLDSLSFSGVFAAANELSGAYGLMFDADGDLLVVSLFGQGVVKFEIAEGATVGSTFWANLAYPSGLTAASDGSVLVTSLGNNNPNDPIYPELFPGSVFKFDGATGSMIGVGPFLVGDDDFQPTSILLRPLQGDFDADGQLTALDIDLLSAAVRERTHPATFDLNGDGLVDTTDRNVWVVELKRSYLGDANFDGEFNSGDFITVLAAGEYEDEVVANSGWATGDWNGDWEFDSGDLVSALQAGGYELGPRAAISSVPEPAMATLIVGAGLPAAIWWRRRHKSSRQFVG
jgi:hypothetical protein